MVLGLLYGVAQVLQTTGLAHTDASVSGFITGTYVVLTPVLGAVLLHDRIGRVDLVRRRPGHRRPRRCCRCRGSRSASARRSPWPSAILYAGHIVGARALVDARGGLGLATVQAGVITVVAPWWPCPTGSPCPPTAGQWASLLYMALVAGALALWAQTWAQAHLTATRAAIVMALEPVFAALFAVTLGGESLTGRMLVGGALVVAAMYLVELRSTPRDPGRLGGRRATRSRRCTTTSDVVARPSSSRGGWGRLGQSHRDAQPAAGRAG